MLRKIALILIAIAILGRFIALDWAPPHLSNDEIGAAYDAYSVSKTLSDEHNQFLPILFASHGIYRSALAVYIPMISIMAFGNNDFAVRLPSAILGSLTIILLGLLVFELTKNINLSIIASLNLAFSPWHFSASRWAMESNYALFFIVLGIYLFFYGLSHHKTWATLFSFVAFTCSIYAYYTEWGLTPLIISLLLFLYRDITFRKKIYYLGVILFTILLIPLALDWFHHLSSSRASTEVIVGQILSRHELNFLQKGQLLLKVILDKYSVYTNLGYLFFYGAYFLPKTNPYQAGFLLSPLVIGFIFGLYKLRSIFQRHTYFIYSLLVVSPLIAAITEGDINNLRSLPEVLPITIITSVGSFYILSYLRKKILLKSLATGLILVSLFYTIQIYFLHFPIQNAEGFEYGFKQIALYINEHGSNYEKIIIDPRFGDKEFYYYGVPNEYIPFYTNLDPRQAQNARQINQGIAFDKYEFRNVEWDRKAAQKNYLYVVPHDNIPNNENIKQVEEIQLPNHKVEFRLYSL